ncbi:pre-RNA processing PIH1/Nop17-domain-containing protein [Pilobolus umbonatus]|nr:pre-RNA processing PIH1/Nop17-domain-containing protein [Pilobolus umbonatus]
MAGGNMLQSEYSVTVKGLLVANSPIIFYFVLLSPFLFSTYSVLRMPIIELIEDDAINPFLLNHTNKDKKEFNQLSEEEKRSLIDNITSEVTNDTKILDELTNNYINQISKADFYTVTVQPEAGYVCKTNVISSSSRYMVGTIVYINVCYASAIPAPSIASEKEIQQALNAEPDATYRVPLSMGRERSEGKACLIMDACINTQPFLRSEKDLDYRLYILELAMEYVEQIVSVTLSREFTMPSIKSKGIIPTRVLRLPKPSLMSTIKNEYKHVLPKWELKHTMSIHGDIATIVIDMPDTVHIVLI